MYDFMGPNAGEAIVTLDGANIGTISRFDKYCTYDRLSILSIGTGLTDAVHTVKIELSAVQPDRSSASSQETGAYDPKKYDGTVLRFGSILLVGDIVE
jgi:hypothetical protein